jgi:aminoglycoside 6-adenylyltransferase
MRNSDEMIALIVGVAASDDRIRAVLLNGSQANPRIKKDPLQDFDITYIVTQLYAFTADRSWIDVFGKRRILQLPNAMQLGNNNAPGKSRPSFTYLMLLEDGNRIDLTLYPAEERNKRFKRDSLTVVLLDKDQRYTNVLPPSDIDYYIQRPTEQAFREACNEFWWVSTYVAKALWRHEIIYAKELLETIVRTMFLQIIEWHIGVRTNFSVSIGNGGKHMQEYVPASLYQQILATYPDAQATSIWKALFTMTALFRELAVDVAAARHFVYNNEEDQNVTAYLEWIYKWDCGKSQPSLVTEITAIT